MGLTYNEVEKAGVFAWREDGYLYVGGRLLRVRNGDPERVEVTYTSLQPDEAMHPCFRDSRWRHLPDCSCYYCCSLARSGRGERERREAALAGGALL